MAWKDWGFAPSLFSQAKVFLKAAKECGSLAEQEPLIRASILFALASFEAHFYDVVKSHIQNAKPIGTVPSRFEKIAGSILELFGRKRSLSGVEKVQAGMARHAGIHEAVRDWPKYLLGRSLDTNTRSYHNFVKFTNYRNQLVHGQIAEKMRSWPGKLAQDVETIECADLAQETVSEMIKMTALHFGLDTPAWA
jgi:hypothetical protein